MGYLLDSCSFISRLSQCSFRIETNFLLIQGQYVDGLRAPLIIHPPKEVYEYDEELTIIITEWYHTEHDVLIKKYLSPDDPHGLVPMPGLFHPSSSLSLTS